MIMKRVWLLALLSISLLVACSTSGPNIKIEDAWVRPDPLMENAAGFFVIRNTGNTPDALTGVRVEFADRATLHQSVVEDGVHSMKPIDRLEISPGNKLELRPMSYHVMIMGLKEPLDLGQKVSLVLEFETVGNVIVEATIRKE